MDDRKKYAGDQEGSHDISEGSMFELSLSGGTVRDSTPFQGCLLLKRAVSLPGLEEASSERAQ